MRRVAALWRITGFVETAERLGALKVGAIFVAEGLEPPDDPADREPDENVDKCARIDRLIGVEGEE